MTKILFVDDELDYILPMAFLLKSKGYSAQTTNDIGEALKIIKESAPDIVFLDINMPQADGFEVLRNIRSFNPKIPVIMMSSYVEDKRSEEQKALNISGVFSKGDDISRALALIESVLKT